MKTLIKVIFSIIFTLALFLMIEVVGWWNLRSDIYQGDVGYFWKMKPHISRQVDQPQLFRLETNSEGFRDNERQESTSTVLLLGCSTTLGWGVNRDETFEYLLDQAHSDVQFINGGQPGWSTHQIVMNLPEFTSWKPDVVLVGVGVRDTQRSNRQDLEASPTPWILHRYSIRWLKSLLKESKKVGIQTGTTNRVLPKAFKDNLVRIKNAFPKAVVHFYMFPQVSIDKEYDEVVNTVSHIRISEFSEDLFFEHDPIHLNAKGQQVLFEELNSQLAPILNP